MKNSLPDETTTSHHTLCVITTANEVITEGVEDNRSHTLMLPIEHRDVTRMIRSKRRKVRICENEITT